MQRIAVRFETEQAHQIEGHLELAPGKTRAYAVFAHCFAEQDHFAAKEISLSLAQAGISVLRFGLTGLRREPAGQPQWPSDVLNALIAAAQFLTTHYHAPQLLVGHSVAGTACLAAAQRLHSVQAIATIAASADQAHLQRALAAIRGQGAPKVSGTMSSGDQTPTPSDLWLDHLENIVPENLQHLRHPVLLLHSPADTVVDIHQAGALFEQLKHPKSFISLNQADHFVSHPADARYVAQVISAWASCYLPESSHDACKASGEHAVTVWETGQSVFQNGVCADGHPLMADEPEAMGGTESGPSPFALVAAGLGACTNMTLRMYAEHKGLPVSRIQTTVHSAHTKDGHTFTRLIALEGDLERTSRERLLAIANKCPVHKMLEAGAQIESQLQDPLD